MTAEITAKDKDRNREVIEQLASEITERFNTKPNRLTSIKVCINPKHQKANIYVAYENTSRENREKESGPEDSMANLYDELITWHHEEISENTEESWKDFSYPKIQMERAFYLSEKLKSKFNIVYDKEDLNCYIKDGKACIDKV